MEISWESFRNLKHYRTYSSRALKDNSVIVDHILSYISKRRKCTLEHFTHKGHNDASVESDSTADGGITISNEGDDGGSTMNNEDNLPIRYSSFNRRLNTINTSTFKSSEDLRGTNLIFDLKYCSLQLPIPLEEIHEAVYTELEDEEMIFEGNNSLTSSDYDSCCDEDIDRDYIMLEPFHFLCKIHVTYDKDDGEQWCCCYYDAGGNYIKKRFNTTHIAFDTAKMLATRCRDAAEVMFHHVWIRKRKNLLNRPIPNDVYISP